MIGLAGGLPADELLPRGELGRALATVRADALQYTWPEGIEELRRWIAERLAARGAAMAPDRVIITAGAQQALAIVGTLFRGKSIAVGDATYPAAIDAFRRAGARVVERDGDAQYIVTSVANPQGVSVDERVSRGMVIVDEAYAGLRFDGRLARPLIADAPDRVFHIGTFSKTIAPGLRVGWLIPPAAHHAAALDLKQAADLQTATTSQAVLARLLGELDYEALLERARTEYFQRAVALAEGLRHHAPQLAFAAPEGGFSIWVETDEQGDELALLEVALENGVMFDPGNQFRVAPSNRIAFRLSYSHVAAEQLDEAARRVARALASWRR